MDTKELDTLIPAQESMNASAAKAYNEMYQDMFQPLFGPILVKTQQTPVLIRTHNNKDFRVFIKSSIYLTPQFINTLCHFIDSRTQEQSITFILGTKTEEFQLHMLGSILTAMMTAKCQIITLAVGYCSFFETAIWCYGKERKVLRYGALTFGKGEFITVCPKYEEYFNTIYERAKDIGVLTEEDIAAIKDTGKEKMILSTEISQ